MMNANSFLKRIQGLILSPQSVCIAWIFYQTVVQLSYGNLGSVEKLQICGESNKSKKIFSSHQ